MSKDILGCLNGVAKVASAFNSELISEINKRFGLVSVLSGKPVTTRLFYGEVRFDNIPFRTFADSSSPRDSKTVASSVKGYADVGSTRGSSSGLSNRHYHTQVPPTFTNIFRHKEIETSSELKTSKRTICTDTTEKDALKESRERIHSKQRKV